MLMHHSNKTSGVTKVMTFDVSTEKGYFVSIKVVRHRMLTYSVCDSQNYRPNCLGNYGIVLTKTQDNGKRYRRSRNTTHTDLALILLPQVTLNSTMLSNTVL